MKILHVCDIASVGKIICHELDKLYGVDCNVLTRKELDVFKFGAYYWHVTTYTTGRVRRFALTMLKHALKCDIIHVHTWDKCLPYLRKTFPKKKIVIHYHGGDIRGQWARKEERYKHADMIVVSTPKLLDGKPDDYNIRWIPNPVDINHWKRGTDYRPKSALYIRQHFDKITPSEETARKISEKENLKMFVLNREKVKYPYSYFPQVLEMYEYFLDYKHGRKLKDNTVVGMSPILEDMSLTALQQLCLGGKVHHNYKLYNKFPSKHSSEIVAKGWYKIYENL